MSEIEERRTVRRKLEQDVAAFLQRGGKIEEYPYKATEEIIREAKKNIGDWMKEDRAKRFGEGIR